MKVRQVDRARAGMSLIEVALAGSILTLLAQAMVESAQSMGRMTSTGNVRTILQIEGQQALSAMIADLEHSGFLTVNGKSYPYVFDGGVAQSPFDSHGHTLPGMDAEEGDPDHGVLREIIFVLPADLDGDGRPDMDINLNGTPELDGDGDGVRSEESSDLAGIWDPTDNTIDDETGVVWSHREISYVLITRADGENYLERRVDGDSASARRVAECVERIQIDSAVTCQWTIPLQAVRVQVFFRKHDPDGALYRHESEVVVTMRNG